MSNSRQITLWCDSKKIRLTDDMVCPEWFQRTAPSLAFIRSEAALKGWTSSARRDLCPQCSGNTIEPATIAQIKTAILG